VGESVLCIMMLVSGRLNWNHYHKHPCSATNLSDSGKKNMGMIISLDKKNKASLLLVESGGKGEWEGDFQSPSFQVQASRFNI
jgi:hypothetical protein